MKIHINATGVEDKKLRTTSLLKEKHLIAPAKPFLIIYLLLYISLAGPLHAQGTQPNILFIAIDDLRPELGAYGSEIAVTPNLDALAAEGILFERAYCQQAICSPSRASVMTGARPETIGVVENYTYFRDLNPDIITLPQHFINNGYEAVNIGKIYHGEYNDPELSWNRRPAKDKMEVKEPQLIGGYALAENQEIFRKYKAEMIARYGDAAKRGLGNGPAFESADVPDNTYEDGYDTELAIATMKDLVATSDKPFFMGLGYYRPHLNWAVPKKYWDLYDRKDIKLSTQTSPPLDGAAMGIHPSFELRVRYGIPKEGPISEDLALSLKHAYLASVSYVDAQIGKVIAALEESGLRDNTIIVIWSDHGWHLGEMGIWGKATNYEIATRVPLIVWSPTMKEKNRGRHTDALVELIDLYPTLSELAGLPIPDHVEGQSFVPLLSEPDLPWKAAAYSQFPTPALREWAANPLSQGMRETYFGPLIQEVEERIKEQQKDKWDRDLFENHLMGYAMRTDRYRMVAWKDRRSPQERPIFVELYDHQNDGSETVNIADTVPGLVEEMLKQLSQDLF
ncbi:iduronate-2-sulfatase [Echinicola pacifica]|uniref:Iduronate-2-sulfatase n=1 Tax=Echinicola pacifica TaxID=346377 RepID=A0A918QAT9_9BACT|nr:sulfatase [Echinicola pacifica]GGZ40132.1 iduronate-2-sulfatase [Echinicola pacifica]